MLNIFKPRKFMDVSETLPSRMNPKLSEQGEIATYKPRKFMQDNDPRPTRMTPKLPG